MDDGGEGGSERVVSALAYPPLAQRQDLQTLVYAPARLVQARHGNVGLQALAVQLPNTGQRLRGNSDINK